ncbi:MAG: hypothetical protein CM1200mP15_23200 [Dehalococcoidia bacterium]|nr:MAG: hypothetical protein CM1200mP15_23200 [Dehalococcoidia bacterium]
MVPYNDIRQESRNAKTPPEETSNDISKDRYLDEKIFIFGISRDKLEAAQAETGKNVETSNELKRATLV